MNIDWSFFSIKLDDSLIGYMKCVIHMLHNDVIHSCYVICHCENIGE